MSHLDSFIAHAHFQETHDILVPTSPSVARRAAKHMRAQELSPIVKILFAIRAIPALLKGSPADSSPSDDRPFLEQMCSDGFLMLHDARDELVLGVITQPWHPCPTPVAITSAQAFLDFDDPQFAKIAFNMQFEETPRGTIVTTETRVFIGAPWARRYFLLYWLLIRLGSGAIRRLWLRAIRRRAIRDAHACPDAAAC